MRYKNPLERRRLNIKHAAMKSVVLLSVIVVISIFKVSGLKICVHIVRLDCASEGDSV